MPYKGTKIGGGGARPGAGRPLNVVRQMCQDAIFNDKLIENLSKIAKSGSTQKDQLRAIEIILDRAYGKPDQHIDATTGGEKIYQSLSGPDLLALRELIARGKDSGAGQSDSVEAGK